MKSIAIWYKPENSDIPSIKEVELHFNMWKIPNGNKKIIRYLDIGIKLDNTVNVDVLKIYFPFVVDKKDFEDIVDRFITKPDLVSAIFNENYNVTSKGTSKQYQLTDANGNPVFDIYKTSDADITKTKKFNGSIFNISVPKENKKFYFRFRIKGAYVDSLSSIFSPTNAVIESAFSKMEMIDFRVNEARDLDLSLLEEISKENGLMIKKQHFFFICSIEEEIIGFHQSFINCRNLENYRWNSYVDITTKLNQIFLAYHWKDANIESSNILIKTKYERNNWVTILKFLTITIIIELIGHFLWYLIKE